MVMSVSIGSEDKDRIDSQFAKSFGLVEQSPKGPRANPQFYSYVKYLLERMESQVAEIIADTQLLLEEGPYLHERVLVQDETCTIGSRSFAMERNDEGISRGVSSRDHGPF